MLRALLARVEELEAVQTGRTSFYEYDKRRLERGRLQGLDEAKDSVIISNKFTASDDQWVAIATAISGRKAASND